MNFVKIKRINPFGEEGRLQSTKSITSKTQSAYGSNIKILFNQLL